MFIQFETSELTELDKQVLAVLAGGSTAPAQPTAKAAPKAEKAAPKAEKKAEPESTPESTPEPAAEADGQATMKDAVELATKLVSSGEAAKVKVALNELGAKRVSELSEENVPAFVAKLS